LRYRANPVTLNAWQFDGSNWDEIESVVGSHLIDVNAERSNFISADSQWVDIPAGIVALVWVAPSHQWAGVKAGDYIVEDSEGNFYPCDKEIFERKYSPMATGVIVSDDMAIRHIQQGRRFGNIG